MSRYLVFAGVEVDENRTREFVEAVRHIPRSAGIHLDPSYLIDNVPATLEDYSFVRMFENERDLGDLIAACEPQIGRIPKSLSDIREEAKSLVSKFPLCNIFLYRGMPQPEVHAYHRSSQGVNSFDVKTGKEIPIKTHLTYLINPGTLANPDNPTFALVDTPEENKNGRVRFYKISQAKKFEENRWTLMYFQNNIMNHLTGGQDSAEKLDEQIQELENRNSKREFNGIIELMKQFQVPENHRQIKPYYDEFSKKLALEFSAFDSREIRDIYCIDIAKDVWTPFDSRRYWQEKESRRIR